MMVSTYLRTFLALFGSLICIVACQEGQGNGTTFLNTTQLAQTTQTSILDDDVDDDANSATAKLTNVTNLDDFIALLTDEHGNKISRRSLFSDYESVDGKITIRGGGRMAEPDDRCSPRLTSVKIDMPTTNENVVYFPECTQVARCGGCTGNSHIKCVPAYIERVALNVIKASIPFPGSSNLHFSGHASVIVERHLKCKPKCMMDAQQCGPKKKFLKHSCGCRCRRQERCEHPHIWYPHTCECGCINEKEKCCTKGELCSKVWNTKTCRCELTLIRQFISHTNNMSDAQIDAYYRAKNISIPNESQPINDPAPATTTPTSTSTTTAITTENPCAKVQCPKYFTHHIYKDVCTCRPTRHIQRPRPRPRGRRPRRTGNN